MTAHSSEAQLILDSLHAFVHGETCSIWSPDLNWERLLALSASQRLTPVLRAGLEQSALPTEVHRQLDQATRQQRIRTALLVEAFATINQAFMEAGIAVMPVKGMFLAYRVYQSVNYRYFDDIDLLIPAAAASEAVTIMKRLGYVIHPQAEKPDWHHLAPFLHQKSKVVVELHTDVIRRARSGWDVDEIWQRAERGRIAGVETYLISEVDALIHTALHARHSLNKRLSFFLDAYLQMRQLEVKGEAGGLPDLIRAAGGSVALAYLLEVGAKLWGNAAATHIINAPRWRIRLMDRLANWDTLERRDAAQVTGPLPNLLEMMFMDAWSHSLRMGYRLMFPPPQFLTEFYGTEHRFTYSKRLLSRTRRFAQQLFTRQ